jgi:hypothetical protein
MVLCATWPSSFYICWRQSPGSPVPAARAPSWPNPCSSSINSWSSIAPGSVHQISASLIAWSPACVRSSSARAADPYCDCPQTLNALTPASSADSAEISPAVLAHGRKEAGPKGTQSGSGGRSRRHETAESDLGLSTDRSTDRPGLRNSHHQRCGAAHSRRSIPAGARLGGAVLAHGPRSHDGQSVESRPVSMRIGRPAHPLGWSVRV